MALVTFFALIYVCQQTAIFRLAYVGQKKLVLFQELLDKNSLLRYNINKTTSLVAIGNRVYESRAFEMPNSYRLVKLITSEKSLRRGAVSKTNIASRLLGVTRQAEAKTLNNP